MNWNALNLAAPEFEGKAEPPAVCQLVYTGRRHLVSGVPEAAKTLFALIVGLEHSRGGLGRFALVDFESGPHATRLMLADLGATAEELTAIWYVEAAGPPDEEDFRSLLDMGVTLAAIDAAAGAYGVSGLDDNARKDAEAFGRMWVDPLWQAGIGSLVIDHVTKNAEARGRFAIGSERKAGRVDVHLGLEVVKPLTRGGAGSFRVRTHKDRPGWLRRPYAADLRLASDPETHRLTWTFCEPNETSDAWKPTQLMEKVSRYLERQTEPVSRSQVEQHVTGKGQYLRQAMDELVAGGYADERSGPRGAKLLAHLRAFDDLVPIPSQPVPVAPRPDLVPRPPSIGDEDDDPDAPCPTLGEDDEVERLAHLAEGMDPVRKSWRDGEIATEGGGGSNVSANAAATPQPFRNLPPTSRRPRTGGLGWPA